MSKFVTNDILAIWHSELVKRFSYKCRLIAREYSYINKCLPFRALHMGKKRDEYFLDATNKKILTKDLLNDLNLLILKDFQDGGDLSLENEQAKKARSIADIYIEHETAQVVIELEIFKDKPFSNLIYIPEVCKTGRKVPFCFIHCFAPERLDKEAELTRRVGSWLQQQPTIEKYEYIFYIMPSLPDSIKYLLPNKRAVKPKSYRCPEDRIAFQQYVNEFYEQRIIPKVSDFLDAAIITGR